MSVEDNIADNSKKQKALFGHYSWIWGFTGGSDSKEPACNAEDPCLIPESGRSPGEGNGNPFQYSCLENPMDRGGWQATVHGVAKNQTMTVRLTLSHLL